MSDLFKDKAQTWDARDTVKALSQGIGAALLQKVPFSNTMQVLDFGAGTGLLSGHVAPLVAKVLALDTSEAMLKQLQAKPELQANVETVCQNILEQPLGQSFDLIISAMALHHVADTARLVQTFAAHLKPGGKLALADLDREDGSFHPKDAEGVFHTGFERQALQLLLSQNGFEQIEFETAHTVIKVDQSYPVFLVTATLA